MSWMISAALLTAGVVKDKDMYILAAGLFAIAGAVGAVGARTKS